MGRKVCLKKIENVTRCQVTFSKRRSSLIKKAHEIAICCDAEVALVAFSPAGRISQFSSPKRIEEVIHRYVDLPPDKKFNDMDDVEEKLRKLQQLSHIKGDQSKLFYLDKQLENLEQQIKNSTLQLQILETDLKLYEPQEQEPTLDEISQHGINIRNSLAKIIERKNVISAGIPLAKEQQKIPYQMQMVYDGVTPSVNYFCGYDSNAFGSNLSQGKLPMQINSWLAPHSDSSEVPEKLIQNRINQGNVKTMCNQGLAISTTYNTRNISEKMKSQIPFKFQTPMPLVTRETQFLPPMENTFRSAAQSYPEIPNHGVFGNGSFSQTLYDIQPSNLERTAPLPLGENIFMNFPTNTGQIRIDNSQTRIDQTIPAPGNLSIGINKHNGDDVMDTTIFYNQNNFNSGISEFGYGIGESNPPQDLLSDDTPGTSSSQTRENGNVNLKYNGFTYKDFKDLLN